MGLGDEMKLLLAEDDLDLRNAVKTLLELSGYQVDTVGDGLTAEEYIAADEYDGIILDWMMPGKDGVEVLRDLRGSGSKCPCLLLTAKDSVEDRITGLDAGADDYLPKPFDAGELLARIRAMLRRRDQFIPDVLTFEDLVLNKGDCTLSCGNSSVKLTGKSYRLMEYLMENPNMLHSPERLMSNIWGWDSEAEINVVWVNISVLRKRLAELETCVEIRLQRGTGYILEKRR